MSRTPCPRNEPTGRHPGPQVDGTNPQVEKSDLEQHPWVPVVVATPLTCSGVNSAHTDPLAPAHRRAAVHPRAETPRLHRLHPRRVRVDDHRARRRLHRPTDIHGTGPTGHHRHRLVDPARTPHPTASPQSPGPATRTDPRQHRHDPGRRRSPDQRDPSDRQRLGEQVPGPRRAGGCGPCLRRGDHQFLPGTVVRGDSGDSGGQYR